MKALITAEINKSLLEEIESLIEVTLAGWAVKQEKLSEEEIIKLMKGKEILITSYDEITRKVIEECKELKLIACTRSNPVNIDIHAAKEKGITVIYTPGRNADSAAEFTIALMLNIARKIPMAYKALKDGKFLNQKKSPVSPKKGLKEDVTWALGSDSPYVLYKGFELKRKILGLIGYGSIGRKVANIARGLGMYIYVYDPYISEVELNDNVCQKVGFDQLLRESDFISCHCSVTSETTDLLSSKEFKMMKNTAFLINTSRGAIIDEKALIQALKNHEIAGAALDVYETEPLWENHPFIELDNMVITPHLGGATIEAITNHTKMIIEDLKRYLKGEKLLYQYIYLEDD